MMRHDEATRRGKALLKRMKGSGWTLDVWENLGWHYAVENGPLTVYSDHAPSGGITYSTLLSDDPERRHCGSHKWSPSGRRYRNPNRAVTAQLKTARGYVEQVDAIVTGLEKAVKEV